MPSIQELVISLKLANKVYLVHSKIKKKVSNVLENLFIHSNADLLTILTLMFYLSNNVVVN